MAVPKTTSVRSLLTECALSMPTRRSLSASRCSGVRASTVGSVAGSQDDIPGEDLPVHRCQEGRALDSDHVPRARGLALRVSRLGDPRAPSARAIADTALTGRIAEIHKQSRNTYGSPRVHAELRLEDDVRVGPKRVERLMRSAGLSGRCDADAGRQRSACRRSEPHRIWSSGTLTRPPSIACGARISPTSGPGGVAVPGLGDGLLQPPDRRLGDDRPPPLRSVVMAASPPAGM